MITTKHHHYLLSLFIVIIAVAFLAFIAYQVRTGPGSTQSKATTDTFLTPGDDALSLQQDLEKLKTDPASSAETQLYSVQ